jgi:hypothetical protein
MPKEHRIVAARFRNDPVGGGVSDEMTGGRALVLIAASHAALPLLPPAIRGSVS